MTSDEKKALILHRAASPIGASPDIYWNEAKELRDAGLIIMNDAHGRAR